MRAPGRPDLVAAARQGERQALDLLLESVWPDAYRIAYGVTNNTSLAEDAAQEACASASVAIAGLRDPLSFRPWFYRLVVRAATQIVKTQPRTVGLVEHDDSGTADLESIDVERALATLSPELRVAVVLHFYSGLTSYEIARLLRIPAPTVRFRLAVAKRRLRPLLEVRLPSSSPVILHEVVK